jgi:hypothetical protein
MCKYEHICAAQNNTRGVTADGGDVAALHPTMFAIHDAGAWEKQVLSARGFKRVGRHSEYAM